MLIQTQSMLVMMRPTASKIPTQLQRQLNAVNGTVISTLTSILTSTAAEMKASKLWETVNQVNSDIATIPSYVRLYAESNNSGEIRLGTVSTSLSLCCI